MLARCCEVLLIVLLSAAVSLRADLFRSAPGQTQARGSAPVRDAVQIVTFDRRCGSGACVVLDDQICVLTARHVVARQETGLVRIGRRAFLIRKVIRHPTLDVALVWCYWGREGYLGRVFELAEQDPKQDDPLWICGWSSARGYLRFQGWCAPTVAATPRQSYLAIRGVVAEGGQSGGPVVDRHGRLVSILWGVSRDETLAVPPRDLRCWLQDVKLNLSPDRPGMEGVRP